jgi:endonuclease/exonuclease/phosphatase family metal-dependent hydrolase
VHPTHTTLIAGALLACAGLTQCAARTEADEADVRVIAVMSANLRWGADPPPNSWELRRPRVVGLLRQEAPDVVGLQESRDAYVDELLEDLPGYAAYPTAGDRKNSILYRTDRLELDRATSDEENARVDAPEQSWGEGSVRLPLCARLVVAGTKRGFYVYNNHLDHRSLPSRKWSVEVLIDRIGSRKIDDPVVLTGDFNAPPEEVTMAFLRGEATLGRGDGAIANPFAFVDSFGLLHPGENAVGTFHGFLGTRLGRRIDYVFAGPGLRVQTARILRDDGRAGHLSDHYPVMATLQLP